jgi:hypothetical protein
VLRILCWRFAIAATIVRGTVVSMIERKEEEEADEEADRTGLGSGKELSREDFIVRKVSFVSSSSSCMNIKIKPEKQ